MLHTRHPFKLGESQQTAFSAKQLVIASEVERHYSHEHHMAGVTRSLPFDLSYATTITPSPRLDFFFEDSLSRRHTVMQNTLKLLSTTIRTNSSPRTTRINAIPTFIHFDNTNYTSCGTTMATNKRKTIFEAS